MDDFSSALSFSAAAPFIAFIISVAKSYYPLPKRFMPLIAFGLTIAWGLVLWQSDYYTGDTASFIIIAVTVAAASAGISRAGEDLRSGTNREAGGVLGARTRRVIDYNQTQAPSTSSASEPNSGVDNQSS